MAKRRKLWPEWWEWELKISSHVQKRFLKRSFTEIDLRRMMEHGTSFKRARYEGRWIIATRFRGKAWEIVVEPLADETKLEVITSFEVWND